MMYLIFLGLVFSGSAFVKRDADTSLFQSGKEYVYGYSSALLAGSEDYVNFASAANITGELHIQGGASVLNVQLKNVELGLYNGEWRMNALPLPEFERKTFPQLAPLSEPFAVKVQGGQVQGIVLNKNIPIWAQNMQRGIASALQIDVAHVDIHEGSIFQTEEKTVVGECVTEYVVIPGINGEHGQVRKSRSHDLCKNLPKRVRSQRISEPFCPDSKSRDTLNSTGFGIYDFEIKDGSMTLKRISVGSTAVYNLFGTEGGSQYSLGTINAVLKEIKSDSTFVVPVDGKETSNLAFVFENGEDVDLSTSDQKKAADKLVEKLIRKLHGSLESVEDMESNSIVPLVSALDYSHLKQVENRFKGGDINEYKLYLDALVVAGTGPSSLVVRDIVKGTTESVIIGRIISPLPNYVRNPTEKLLEELEPLLSKTDVTMDATRSIEFSFASLLGRTCKNGCQKSGLLQKYVKIFADRISAASGFEEKTQAVLALRNIQLPVSARALLDIVKDKKQDRTVRVAAMGGLSPLLTEDALAFRKNLIPIFFDRNEDPELRNQALLVTLTNTQQESLFKEVAAFMWTELNPNVKNFVATLLRSLANKANPCLNLLGSYANTASKMLPPWKVSEQYSIQLISEYNDRQLNLGLTTTTTAHKSGLSGLPRSLYVGFSGQTAGYGTNYLSTFVRLEGVGKALSSRIMSMTTGVVDFDDLKEVLEKIGIQERQPEPLRIEIALMLHNRVVAYSAVDSKSVTNIPKLIENLSAIKNVLNGQEIASSLNIGGATTETSNEIGIPVSVTSAVTADVGFDDDVSSENSTTTLSRNYNLSLQLNLHEQSSLNNHLPALNTSLSVSAIRSLRVRIPRDMSIGLDIKQQSVNFVINPPTEEEPVVDKVDLTVSNSILNNDPTSLSFTEEHLIDVRLKKVLS